MAIASSQFTKSIRIRPDTTAIDSIEGTIKVDSVSSVIQAYLNGATRTLVTTDQTQTLTNKTIDADVNTIVDLELDNLKAGVLNTSTTLAGASDTQVPSALAVKTYVDDQIDTVDQASEISYNNATSGLTATNVQTALDEIDGNVDNLVTLSGVALDSTSLGTFTGTTIPDSSTVKAAFQSLETAHEEVDQNVNDLITLSGVAENATTLGTFTGTTIPDSSTVKAALQSLETSVETKASSAVVTEIDGNVDDLITLSGVAENSTSLGTFTGTTIPDSSTVKAALQSLETSVETKLGGAGSSTDNALARWDGTSGTAIQNSLVTLDDAGAASGFTQLNTDNLRLDGNTLSSTDTNGNIELSPNGTGKINANKDSRFFQDIAYEITADTATGANATLTAPPTKIIRLTNGSLTSVDMIPAGSEGQQITIINATGNSITINDNTGGTAANRILTGQKANITLKDESSLILEYDDTEARWMVIGGTGGSGSAGINYVSSNPDFEAAATGYTAYADAAGVVPVDATGGSPVTAITRSTSAPLRGAASGLWSKSAANRQGEGFAYAITLDTADQGKMIEISYDYTTSTNFVDGDMRMFIYDVTNLMLIEPNQRDILANSGQAKYRGYFQANSNSTSYRVVWHVATTSALAYDFKLDNVYVGPVVAGNAGTFVSDWVAFTPTGSHTTNATYNGFYRRVGDTLEMKARVTYAGATTAGELTFNLPTGFTIDTNKLTSTSNQETYLGLARITDASVNDYQGVISYSSTTAVKVRILVEGAAVATTATNFTSTSPFTIASGDTISIQSWGIPITGWSTGATASEIPSTTSLICRGIKTSNQTITVNPTKVTFTSIASADSGFDPNGLFDTTNSRLVATESGIYELEAGLVMNNYDAAATAQAFFYVNGVSKIRQDYISAGVGNTRINLLKAKYSLNKGDYVEVYVGSADASWSVVGVAGVNDSQSYFEATKFANPAQIAPNEVIGCSYQTDAGQSIANATTTTILYEDKNFDTHNAMNTATGIYTVPVSGLYYISSLALLQASTAWAQFEATTLFINVNSVEKARSPLELWASTGGGNVQVAPPPVFLLANLVKGDTINVQIRQSSGSSISLNTNGTANMINIYRVK